MTITQAIRRFFRHPYLPMNPRPARDVRRAVKTDKQDEPTTTLPEGRVVATIYDSLSGRIEFRGEIIEYPPREAILADCNKPEADPEK